jgi:hypothetical protein
MNYAGTALPSVSDVDAELRNVDEVRDALEAMGPCISSMQAVLARRERALRDLRQELVAHAAELAEREAKALEVDPAQG